MRALLLLLTSAWLIAAGAASAQEVIWSGLVYATNAEHPAAAPAPLAPYSKQIQGVFGYNQLELLSEHREVMDEQSENWLLPGKTIYLSVATRRSPAKGDYQLNLALYQDKRLLVQTKARLSKGSPLFFRGPLCDQGQLIIVLVVE